MSAKWKVTGIKEIDKALKELGPKLSKKVLRKAARAGAKVVQQQTKANAPVGPTRQTKKAIKVRSAPRSRSSVGADVRIGEGDYKGDTFYAAFTEFGTKYQPAQGWMRRAYESKKAEAKDKIMAETRAGLDSVIKSVAKS